MCVFVHNKIQLRLSFLFLMEDKNRNMHFKTLGLWTEIILKQFQYSWAYLSIFSLHAGVETSWAKPVSLPRSPKHKERMFVDSKARILVS